MKKYVSDFTVKKVIVLCFVSAFISATIMYSIGWAFGIYYGKQIGEAEVIENAILSHDDQYHYLEYNENIHFYK